MKAVFISKENNDVKFTIEFSAEEFDKAVVDAYKSMKDQFEIDGFRKGKAPRKIIEQKYGKGIFFEEAINNLLQKAYPEALSELDLDVIDRPRMEFSKLEEGKGVTVTITVEVAPEVEPKDYKGIEIEQIIPVVDEESVNKELEALRKSMARIENVDRPVKEGDTVILDYAGFVGDNQFDGGTAERQELKIGSGMFIPGFEEQLIDAKTGDKVDVKVTFPEEYHAKELAGKDAVFHCDIHEIKEEILPELDDELAKDVSEFDTLEALKEDIKTKLEENAKIQAKEMAKAGAIKKVVKNNELEIPEIMVDEEVERTIQEINQQLASQGLNVEMYLQFIGKDLPSFKEELRGEAKEKVASRLLLLAIADAENLEVSQEEIENELQKVADAYKMDLDKVKEMIGKENLKYLEKDLRLNKAIEFIYDNGKIEEVKSIKAE